MSIMSDLANATKALNAHRFGVTTAGSNIANVNNPEYSRQRAILGDRGTIQTVVGPRSMGVEVVGFAQMRDTVLDREVLREASINSSLTAQYKALSKAEANMGQEINRTGDSAFIDGSGGSRAGGLAEVINSFFNSFHALSANPGSDAEKESMLQKADMLVQKLNVTSDRFSSLKEDLSSQVETDLENANRLIGEIARLNSEIARAEASNAGQALTLRDQRQARLQNLSEYMQVKVKNITDSGGQVSVSVSTVNGTFKLVDEGRFEQIKFDDSIPGLPQFEIASSGEQLIVKHGSIQGSLIARDGGIQDYISSLDRFASELVVQLNGIYNSGSAPGNTNFFADTGNAAQKTAAGISLDVTLSTTTLRTTNDAAQKQGDNTLVLAIAELDGAKFSGLGDRTFGSFYRATISDLAQNVATVESRLEDEEIVFNLLKEQQDSVSGVSIDEEMTDMIKFQRAFEATARHIRVIDEMLDVIINKLF